MRIDVCSYIPSPSFRSLAYRVWAAKEAFGGAVESHIVCQIVPKKHTNTPVPKLPSELSLVGNVSKCGAGPKRIGGTYNLEKFALSKSERLTGFDTALQSNSGEFSRIPLYIFAKRCGGIASRIACAQATWRRGFDQPINVRRAVTQDEGAGYSLYLYIHCSSGIWGQRHPWCGTFW